MRQAVTLVTGGAGFVGSNFVRRLLEGDDDVRVIVVDRAVDDLAEAHFAPFADRIDLHLGDITDPEGLETVRGSALVTHVVHCAMVAHVPRWEIEDPMQFVHVNIVGTTNVLEWARRLPSLQRVLYVSSGGVYGDPTATSPSPPQPESGPFNPPELYAISKYASELICRRYAELFGLDMRIVRLSWVFGPMERVTSGRTLMSPPYVIARAIADDRAVTIARRTLGAVGDFISAEDIADAMRSLLFADEPMFSTYNIAGGRLTSFHELLDAAAQAHHGSRYVVVSDGDRHADLDHDPALRGGRWNAYDIERMRGEFGWEPRQLVEQLASYFSWMLEDPSLRCPTIAAASPPRHR
jgi:nucleoside-diphosphate-sugar epimerase